jgi:hypothetical protein
MFKNPVSLIKIYKEDEIQSQKSMKNTSSNNSIKYGAKNHRSNTHNTLSLQQSLASFDRFSKNPSLHNSLDKSGQQNMNFLKSPDSKFKRRSTRQNSLISMKSQAF